MVTILRRSPDGRKADVPLGPGYAGGMAGGGQLVAYVAEPAKYNPRPSTRKGRAERARTDEAAA